MTRPSKRELEQAIDDLDGDTNDLPDLSDGWDLVFDDEETPDREPDAVVDGWEYYQEDPDT